MDLALQWVDDANGGASSILAFANNIKASATVHLSELAGMAFHRACPLRPHRHPPRRIATAARTWRACSVVSRAW